MSEAFYIIKRSDDEYKNKWDQTRYIVYSIIQSQSTKSLIPQDVLKFPWDEKIIVPTKSKAELLKHAKEMESMINDANYVQGEIWTPE